MEQIFEEAEVLNGALSTKTQKLVTDALYSYIVELYSNEPAPKDVIECCKATLQLFPCLKTNPSAIEGIVSTLHTYFIKFENSILVFVEFRTCSTIQR